MIGNQNKFQHLPQKILPKKPSIASQNNIFDDILSGEFHTSWEHDLWEVDVVPGDINLDGLDQYAHSLEANKQQQLSSDPMLSENNISIQNPFNGESNHENETVLLEMFVENTDLPPPQDAHILSNPLGVECIEDISQDSVDFNESSESGFDDSFCGWEHSSMMDSNSFDKSSNQEDVLQAALTETFPQQRLQKTKDWCTEMSDNEEKKRVGRPRKTSIHTVASVPVRGPKKLIENMKRRRYESL